MTELPPGLKRRKAPVVVLALLVALGIAVVLSLLKSPAQVIDVAEAGATTLAPGESAVPRQGRAAELPALLVHVTGAVNAPGVVSLAEGARVLDAIAAAGGLATGADTAAVNLARMVADGEQVHVPLVGEAPPPGAAAGGAAASGPINLNTADLAALETLPRVGPTLAQRIIDWRTENGPFRSVDELRDVTGIGEKIFADIAPLVRAP